MADSTSSMPIGTTGAGGGNMLRITGLNTGLDIDAMVKKMLTADQTKIDKAKQQQQLIQWRQEAYQSIIKDVKDLQSTYFDLTKSTNYLLSSNAYNNMVAASSDVTAVSAKAGADAAAGTYKILVNNIASSAAITSTSSVNSQYTISKKADNVTDDLSIWTGTDKSINFTVDEKTDQTIDLSGFTGTTAAELTSYINNKISNNTNLNGKVSASLITTLGSDGIQHTSIKFTPTSESTISIVSSTIGDIAPKTLVSASSSTKLTDLGTELDKDVVLNLKYNGKEISVNLDNSSSGKNGSATVGDLITTIKNATGGAVTGKFDDMTGKFILQTTSTGSTSSLSIEQGSADSETTTDLLTALGLPAVGSSEASSQGKDALVSITSPGSSTATTLTESSNNFTVNGVSYSITGETTDPVSISVTQDTSKVHDLITNFIDKYNNLIGEIQDKLSEKKDYDYAPLTDTQKSSMSDTDITNWENKAKEGLLRNDDNLEQLLNDITSAFTSPVVDSSGKSVSTLYFGNIGSNSIGIDTSDDYSRGGKISIVDEQKFTDVITNHADEILKLFTAKPNADTTDSTGKFKQSGIFQRINDIINSNVGVIGTTLNSGTLTKYANLQDDYSTTGGGGTGTLPDQIYHQQLLIKTLTDRMNDDQTKYYNQFTQLEVAMEQLNAQQSSLSMYLS